MLKYTDGQAYGRSPDANEKHQTDNWSLPAIPKLKKSHSFKLDRT